MKRLLLRMVFLTGCVSSESLPGPGDGTGATYRHPQTGEVRRCEKTLGNMVGGGLIGVGVAYGNCKSDLESQGFVRTNPR
jgi:hypothetical protein